MVSIRIVYLNLCTTAITILAINTRMITGASSIAEANVFVTFVVAVASDAAVGVGNAVLTWSYISMISKIAMPITPAEITVRTW